MASDPFCGEASGSVDIHLNVEGSTLFCAQQTGDEHQIPKSHGSDQRNVNEVNLI